jgi:hypothetical protein
MSIGARRNFRLSRIALKIVSNPVRRAVGYLCILMSFALLMVIAAAQTTTTTHVTGTVRSASLPIPGATVAARQGDRRISTTTDENGQYELDLPSGTWNVEVNMMAFGTARRDLVVGNTPASVDYALEIRSPQGQQSANRGPGGGPPGQRGGFRNLNLNQTAQVDALTEAAQTNAEQQPNSSTSANANEAFLMNGTLDRGLQQAQQQPNLFGEGQGGWNQPGQQNPFGQPGQNGAAPGGGGFGGGGGAGGFGGGGRGGFGGGGGRAGFGAQAGRRGPGQNGPFGNRARRGRQGYHGSLSFSLNNSALDARPFSLTGETVPKPSFAQSRFSFAGGGPFMIPKLIHSNKTFLFFSYFGTRARNAYDGVGTVPTEDERNGDFSSLLGTTQLYYPGTTTMIPGNIIPSGLLNQQSLTLLSLIPLPNQPGTVRNYQYTTSTGNNADNFGVRANHNLSQNDRFDGNFNAQHRNGDAANLFGWTDPTSGAGITTNVGWTHDFSPKTLNHIIGSFSRNSNLTSPFFAYGSDISSGIEGVSQAPIDYGPPTLSFTNYSTLSDSTALRTVNQTTGVTDTLTLIRGTHSITAGGGYRRMQINQKTDQNARGTFTFTGLETSEILNGLPVPNTGNDFADFLLGYPYDSSVSGDRSDYFRAYAANAFVSDDWHLRDNLTLTIGLRYEFFSPYTEKYDRLANLIVPPYFIGAPTEVLAGQSGVPSGLINPAKDLFSPRAGLAWKPWSQRSTVVRMGYGIFYNGSVYAQFPAQLAAQPPFITNLSLLNSTTSPILFQNILASASPAEITNTYAVDPNYRPGYAQTWNVSVQQNLPKSFILDLEYLGTKGTRLDDEIQPYRTLLETSGGHVASFVYDQSDANSIYHALQARLIRRFAHGISMNGLYTFSKSIDDASTIGGGTAVVAQNPFDISAERGLSSFDQRNTLNLTFVLTSPVGGPSAPLHSYRWAERTLKDWTLSGGVTFSSGVPLTAELLGNQADVTGTGAVGSSRAEATGLPIGSPGYPFFNPLAFTTPTPGELGDAGRNTIPGPDQWALNLSLARVIDFGERRRLEFRIDTTNITNSVFYTSFGTVVNSTTYDLATAAAPMRTLTFTTRFRF